MANQLPLVTKTHAATSDNDQQDKKYQDRSCICESSTNYS